MTAGNLFFMVCTVACVVGALATVIASNPIRGAMGLLLTILGIAGMVLQLSAQFLAAIQLIVYAGAVVVLFVFIMMLLGAEATGKELGAPKARVARLVGAGLMAVLGSVGLALTALRPTLTRFTAARPEHGSIEAVGGDVFGPALVPFELTTALLLVAAIGAIAVVRARPTARPPRSPELGETKRLFVGPLHPRDAGRPLSKESRS